MPKPQTDDSHNDLQHSEELAELYNLNPLSPLEEVSIEGVEEIVVKVMIIHFVRMGLEKDRVFGFTSPTAEEVRHNRRVAEAIDQMTGGQSLYLQLSDGIEWNRLTALADDVLEGRRSMVDKEIAAVRKKYKRES